MTIEESVSKGIMDAMKARETLRLEVLRNIKKALIEAKSAAGAPANLDDEACVKIIRKLAKQGRDAAAIFREQGRDDLFAHESAQVAILEEFLPAQVSDEQLEITLRAIIERLQATPADKGKVIGTANKELAGKADGQRIASMVKSLLG